MENNIKEVIKTRLNTLIALNETKQKDLAAVLGVKDNVISYFCSGARTPNVEQLNLLSDYFNVSLDYLVGRSDIKTPNADIRAVCEYTGLTQEVVENLHTYEMPFKELIADISKCLKLLNFMLSSQNFDNYLQINSDFSSLNFYSNRVLTKIKELSKIEIDIEQLKKDYNYFFLCYSKIKDSVNELESIKETVELFYFRTEKSFEKVIEKSLEEYSKDLLFYNNYLKKLENIFVDISKNVYKFNIAEEYQKYVGD